MSDANGRPDEKSPVEQAMEVFVYAPIGLLFEGASILPQLVEKGRSQVTMAKMIGRFAVEQGKTEAAKTASKLGDQAAGLLDFLGDSVTPVVPDPEPAPAPAPKARPASSGRAAAAAKTAVTAKPQKKSSKAEAPATDGSLDADPDLVVAVATLAIPDYDGLSASHVVNRLAGLSREELEAVRSYESAHRGRKTILTKIAQLQSS